MVRRAHQRDLKRIALLKNSSVDIADLPEDTPVIAADIAAPGIIDSQHLPGYQETEIISYSTMLGSPLPDFFARTQEKRTVWLPAHGFLNQKWHDGPLIVIEPEGLVSSFVPTGSSAVLLLALDATNSKKEKDPVGKPKEQALAIEGSLGMSLLRGSAAATEAATASLTDAVHITIPTTLLVNTPRSILIQLALLRVASGHDRQITICTPDQRKSSPQLRRLCENAGIGWSSWDEPDASLEQMFFWYDQAWDDHLFQAINANGNAIPG